MVQSCVERSTTTVALHRIHEELYALNSDLNDFLQGADNEPFRKFIGRVQRRIDHGREAQWEVFAIVIRLAIADDLFGKPRRPELDGTAEPPAKKARLTTQDDLVKHPAPPRLKPRELPLQEMKIHPRINTNPPDHVYTVIWPQTHLRFAWETKRRQEIAAWVLSSDALKAITFDQGFVFDDKKHMFYCLGVDGKIRIFRDQSDFQTTIAQFLYYYLPDEKAYELKIDFSDKKKVLAASRKEAHVPWMHARESTKKSEDKAQPPAIVKISQAEADKRVKKLLKSLEDQLNVRMKAVGPSGGSDSGENLARRSILDGVRSLRTGDRMLDQQDFTGQQKRGGQGKGTNGRQDACWSENFWKSRQRYWGGCALPKPGGPPEGLKSGGDLISEDTPEEAIARVVRTKFISERKGLYPNHRHEHFKNAAQKKKERIPITDIDWQGSRLEAIKSSIISSSNDQTEDIADLLEGLGEEEGNDAQQ